MYTFLMFGAMQVVLIIVVSLFLAGAYKEVSPFQGCLYISRVSL